MIKVPDQDYQEQVRPLSNGEGVALDSLLEESQDPDIQQGLVGTGGDQGPGHSEDDREPDQCVEREQKRSQRHADEQERQDPLDAPAGSVLKQKPRQLEPAPARYVQAEDQRGQDECHERFCPIVVLVHRGFRPSRTMRTAPRVRRPEVGRRACRRAGVRRRTRVLGKCLQGRHVAVVICLTWSDLQRTIHNVEALVDSQGAARVPVESPMEPAVLHSIGDIRQVGCVYGGDIVVRMVLLAMATTSEPEDDGQLRNESEDVHDTGQKSACGLVTFWTTTTIAEGGISHSL